MAGKGSNGKRGSYERRNMLEGLTRKNPPGVDASMAPKGGSVNVNATRDKTAPTPKTLGPRDA